VYRYAILIGAFVVLLPRAEGFMQRAFYEGKTLDHHSGRSAGGLATCEFARRFLT